MMLEIGNKNVSEIMTLPNSLILICCADPPQRFTYFTNQIELTEHVLFTLFDF